MEAEIQKAAATMTKATTDLIEQVLQKQMRAVLSVVKQEVMVHKALAEENQMLKEQLAQLMDPDTVRVYNAALERAALTIEKADDLSMAEKNRMLDSSECAEIIRKLKVN